MTFLTAFELEQSSRVLTEVEITTFQKFAVDTFVVATPAVAKLHDPGKNCVRDSTAVLFLARLTYIAIFSYILLEIVSLHISRIRNALVLISIRHKYPAIYLLRSRTAPTQKTDYFSASRIYNAFWVLLEEHAVLKWSK